MKVDSNFDQIKKEGYQNHEVINPLALNYEKDTIFFICYFPTKWMR